MIGHFSDDPAVLAFINSHDLQRLAPLGTSCPDHFLRTKIKDVKANLDADEKEMRYLTRPFVKKDTKPKENNTSNSAVKEEPKVQNKSEQSEETFLSKEQLEVVTVAETVEENSADNVATENNSISIETPVEAEELPIQELKENVSEASTETTAE